jgi:hypothetical protein
MEALGTILEDELAGYGDGMDGFDHDESAALSDGAAQSDLMDDDGDSSADEAGQVLA